LHEIAEKLRAEKIEALGIVFLHGFRNPVHEQQAAAILQELLPDLSISLGSVVAPEIREFERMTTTTANAYVQPITRKYVDDLQARLSQTGYGRKLYLMASSGGISAAATARELPIRLLESGPTAGVLAAIYYGRQMGIDSLVTFDMGGTTAKIGLVKDFKASKSNVFEAGRVSRFKKGSGIPIRIPMIELIEIGAGGGSIANIDQLGLLKMGPHSAGAAPGPACYGRGGTAPTVTDANLVLGYYDPGYFLGGAMTLDKGAAETAIRGDVGTPLGLSAVEAAHGIFEVVTQNMISATKVHVAERSEDPRKFYLFAFGGAGPAHAYEIARALQMRGVIIPPGAGAASATGLVTAPVSFDYARSYVTRLDLANAAELNAIFSGMAAEGLAVLEEAGVGRDNAGVTVTHFMDLRHKGQGHEVTVEVPRHILDSSNFAAMAEQFYREHIEKFGHAHRHLAVELITCRTSVAAPAPGIPLVERAAQGSLADARRSERLAYFQEAGGMVMTPVYDRYRMPHNVTLHGPAIIEERESTAICGPSAAIRLDQHGMLFIDIKPADAPRQDMVED
jgi:N-methylhydantoinase A/oxoprolinase/acetone carboxylase beta subunit